jgi:hypothetical protein
LLADIEAIKRETWLKAKVISGADPAVVRKDDYGYWLKYDEFLTNNKMAWDLERRYSQDCSESEIYPVARIRMRRIYEEVEKVICEKMRAMGSDKK